MSPNGAGIITSRVSSFVWRLSLKLCRNDGSSWLLSNVGFLLLYLMLLIWIVMIWMGNTLIIYSDVYALQDPDKLYITSFLDKAYYIGYVLSTMGSGEYTPTNQYWEIYAAAISFTGLVFITIAISYLIPVINAVADKRALANYIAGLGKNPYDILENHYNGKDFSQLNKHFEYLTPEVLKLTKNHQAYPALHYFHEHKYVDSTCIYLSCLDEMISILNCGTEEEKRPAKNILLPLRHALTLFLQTLHGAYLNPEVEKPQLPDHKKFKEIIPDGIDNEQFIQSFSNLSKRRRIILAYLKHHGWSWEKLYGADYTLEFE